MFFSRAASIGSRLKQSFTNFQTSRSTPIEQFSLINEEDVAEKRETKRRSALLAAIATLIGCLLLGLIMVGVASAVAGRNDSGKLRNAKGQLNMYKSFLS